MKRQLQTTRDTREKVERLRQLHVLQTGGTWERSVPMRVATVIISMVIGDAHGLRLICVHLSLLFHGCSEFMDATFKWISLVSL